MRRRRWLKRILLALVALAVIGYVAFWALLFNPLEADVDHLDALVPIPPDKVGQPGVPLSYVVRGPALRKLWTEGFGEAHVRGSPAFQSLVDEYQLEQFLFKQVRDVEEQIRAATKGAFELDVLGDVFGREFLLAGDIDLDQSDHQITDSPYLFLTRVTWKGKLLDVLRYDTVRERVERATRGSDELDEGYRIERTRYWYEVSPPSGKFSRDPEREQKYYFARIRDVLAVSNREELIDGAVRCAERQGDGSIREEIGYKKSHAFDGSADDLRVWVSVHRLDRKGGLTSKLAPAPNEPRSIWHLPFQIVPPALVWDVSLELAGGAADRLVTEIALAEAKLGGDQDLPSKVDSAWRAEPFSFDAWNTEVAERAPRDSTVLAARFAIEPEDFFVLLLDQLTGDQRSLLLDHLQEKNLTPEGFARDIGLYFQNHVGLVLSRLDAEVDGLPLDDPATGGDVDPSPATTLIFRLRDVADAGTLLDSLVSRLSYLGVTMDRRPERSEARPGLDLYPLKLADWQLPDSWTLVKLAIAVRDDRFYLSTNRDALLRLIDTEPESSFASLPEVQAMRDRLPDLAGMLAVVRGRKLRQLLADGRWGAAHEAAAAITESPARLGQERMRLTRELGPLYPDFRELQERITKAMEEWIAETYAREFAVGLARRRDTIESLDPVRAIGFALTLGKSASTGRIVLECE